MIIGGRRHGIAHVPSRRCGGRFQTPAMQRTGTRACPYAHMNGRRTRKIASLRRWRCGTHNGDAAPTTGVRRGWPMCHPGDAAVDFKPRRCSGRFQTPAMQRTGTRACPYAHMNGRRTRKIASLRRWRCGTHNGDAAPTTGVRRGWPMCHPGDAAVDFNPRRIGGGYRCNTVTPKGGSTSGPDTASPVSMSV